MIGDVTIFFVWLLFVALPLQGYAAAVNICCGQSYPKTMEMQGAIPHHHDHHPVAMNTEAKSADQVAYAGDGKHEHTHINKSYTCGTCAGCCMTLAAMPNHLIFKPISSHAPLTATEPTPLVTGFIPAGLERPPRHLPA